MKEIIVASIMFLIAIISFVISFRSYKEKGFLFNNAYIYASKQERETMNKKPHYRQSAIVFFMIGLLFVLNGIHVLTESSLLLVARIIVVVIAIIYAIVSSVKIEKINKQNGERI